MKQKNNGGYSLLELIVVISIIVIISGVLYTGISALTGSKVNKCANLIYSGLQETRVDALSKTTAYLTVSYDSSKEKYSIQIYGKDPVEIGDKNLQITYIVEDSDHNETTRDVASDGLILSFQKGSGAYLPVIESVSGGTFTTLADSDGDSLYCSSITIARGTKTRVITLNQATGKTILE